MSSRRRPDIRAALPRTSGLFRRVRRGLRLRAALRALEPAAVAGLVFWLASIMADAAVSLSATARLVALAATCAAAACAFVWFLARGAAGRIGPVYLAARVEALYPKFAGRLIAAVELATSSARSGPRHGPDDAARAVPRLLSRQAEALVGEVDAARVIAAEAPQAAAHKYLLWSMALVLAAALAMGGSFPDLAARSLFPWLSPETPEAAFFWIRPTAVEVEEGERFFVRASVRGPEPERVVLELAIGGDHTPGRVRMERGPVPRRWTAQAGPVEYPGLFRLVAEYRPNARPIESEWFPIRLLRRPRVRSVSVRYVYPQYTRRAGRREPGGAIDAPVGTAATVELVPERPLARATVVARGRRVAMRRAPGGAWRFRMRVGRSGSYRIELESADGVSVQTGPYPVIARPDRAPRCDASFVGPADGAAEVSSHGAAFRVRAADDFGLEELVLVVRRGGQAGGDVRRDKPPDTCYIPVPGFTAGARAFSRELRVPPQVLPVEPGVTYTYYVRAADGFPPSPHLATSAEKTFRISRSGRQKALLAGERTKKRRPPLLEPRDDEPEEPAGAGGAEGRRPSRSLAGLDEGKRRRPSGGRPKGKPPSSPYASAPGLGAGGQEKDEASGKSPKETASTGRGRSGEQERRREKRQLPGQGGPPGAGRAPARDRTAAGGSSGSRPGAGGGGRRGPRREAPDVTGSGQDGGGQPRAGLREKRPRDGGLPTGAETGTGAPGPETVDEEAVAALATGPEDLAGVRVPPRASGLGRDPSGRAEPATDLGRGLDRTLGPARGRDRVTIPRDEIPTPEVVRSRPVSRMYRALVSEYFRRLEELASDR